MGRKGGGREREKYEKGGVSKGNAGKKEGEEEWKCRHDNRHANKQTKQHTYKHTYTGSYPVLSMLFCNP